jgi:hypothetical protein
MTPSRNLRIRNLYNAYLTALPFRCQHEGCHRSFKSNGGLTKHMRSKHSNPSSHHPSQGPQSSPLRSEQLNDHNAPQSSPLKSPRSSSMPVDTMGANDTDNFDFDIRFSDPITSPPSEDERYSENMGYSGDEESRNDVAQDANSSHGQHLHEDSDAAHHNQNNKVPDPVRRHHPLINGM